jgi:hypothetical protein
MTIAKFLHLSQIYCQSAPDRRRGTWRYSLLLAIILSGASGAFAQTAAPTDLSKANTSEKLTQLDQRVTAAQSSADYAWVLVSAAVVLMMTGPGLGFFYGGLVRRKNTLAIVMQGSALIALITVMWALVGYSLCFQGNGPLIAVGGLDGHWSQVGNQPVGVLIAWGIALVGTIVLLKIVDMITGLRVSGEEEEAGLDITQHGEAAYNPEA